MYEFNAEALFESIEKKAEAKTRVNEGDYYIDGLLHCGTCREPKQCRVYLFGKERTPYCICKCDVARLEAEENARKQMERQLEVQKLRRMGFPESEMDKWTFDIDDGTNPAITKVAMNFVKNFAEMKKRKKGLLFYGSVGTGKTFTAACIVNALIDRGIPCLMTNFPRLVNTIQGMYDGKQQYIDGLNKFDLLVLDDLAAERDTDYMNEIVQNIIDCRYRAGLPTIITTNLSGEEIKNPADIRKQRTYSRLLEMCIPVEVKGADRRREKLKHDYNELNDLLGL